MKPIYLDHSATTPMDRRVLKAMSPYFSADFGNPSSLHSFGQTAAAAVTRAREQAAEFLNCDFKEVIFTSGATEADNLAIFGLAQNLKIKGKPHLITSSVEHPAVLEPAARLKDSGWEITYLPVDKHGIVSLADFKKAIRPNTVLVSVMYVNSEIGSLQPIREIGKEIERLNRSRTNRIYFHTDAVQAANFFTCDVKYLHVDLLSLSGHKIYGPKGIGALFVKKGTPLSAVQLGGHHEGNLRSGTLNVPGIAGLGEALKLAGREREKNNRLILKLRNDFVSGIKRSVKKAVVNTDLTNASPAHANISFAGAEGEAILIALDLEGVAVSTGSACASASLKASPVLLAMGIPEEIAHSTIRFTFGRDNTAEEVGRLLKILPPIVKKLRRMAPDWEK